MAKAKTPKRRGPGRPPKPDSRHLTVCLRYNDEELGKMEKAAKAAKEPLRVWMRKRTLVDLNVSRSD